MLVEWYIANIMFIISSGLTLCGLIWLYTLPNHTEYLNYLKYKKQCVLSLPAELVSYQVTPKGKYFKHSMSVQYLLNDTLKLIDLEFMDVYSNSCELKNLVVKCSTDGEYAYMERYSDKVFSEHTSTFVEGLSMFIAGLVGVIFLYSTGIISIK